MQLLTEELRRTLPALNTQDNNPDPTVFATIDENLDRRLVFDRVVTIKN